MHYLDQDDIMVEQIIQTKKQEIADAISRCLDESTIIIRKNPKKGHKGPRSSQFRGVSLNGKKWQTLVMGFCKKAYRGRHQYEIEAAKDYDRHSILSQGLSVSSMDILDQITQLIAGFEGAHFKRLMRCDVILDD